MLKKDLIEKGFAIKKSRDSVFYTYDYTYTVGLNESTRNGQIIPELLMIGFPVREASKVLDAISMYIFKFGIPENSICSNIKDFEMLDFLLIEVDDIELAKKEMKKSELYYRKRCGTHLRRVFQVVPSNSDKVFDFKNYGNDNDIPLLFNRKKININNLKNISISNINKMEHKLLYKSNLYK